MRDEFTRAIRHEGYMACTCRQCRRGNSGKNRREAHRRARARLRSSLKREVAECISQ